MKYKIILNSSRIKKFNTFKLNESNEDNISILDNGGIPFIVNINNKFSKVYKRELTYDFEKIFTDKENKDGSVLLKLKDKYIFIGSEIYEFTTDDKIIDFKSPIGNSAVPYPVAIGEKYLYFMLDKIYIDKELISKSSDYYKSFYDLDNDIEKHKIKDLKIIIKRL